MDIESTSLLAERQQIMLKVEFLLGLFFKKWPESFCIILTKGSVPRIGKNIFKKGVPKNCICMFKTLFLSQISP